MHLKPPFLCCFRGLLGHAVGVGVWWRRWACSNHLEARSAPLSAQTVAQQMTRSWLLSLRSALLYSFPSPSPASAVRDLWKPRSVNNESPLPKQKFELNRFGDGIGLFNTLKQPFFNRKPHKAWGSSATPVCCFLWRDHQNHPHLIGCSASVFYHTLA